MTSPRDGPNSTYDAVPYRGVCSENKLGGLQLSKAKEGAQPACKNREGEHFRMRTWKTPHGQSRCGNSESCPEPRSGFGPISLLAFLLIVAACACASGKPDVASYAELPDNSTTTPDISVLTEVDVVDSQAVTDANAELLDVDSSSDPDSSGHELFVAEVADTPDFLAVADTPQDDNEDDTSVPPPDAIDVQDAAGVDLAFVSPDCGNGVCENLEKIGQFACTKDCGVDFLCGNGICEPWESATSCSGDCLFVCGNGKCEPFEDYIVCPSDCPDMCGDGLCQPLESQKQCPADCYTVCGDAKCMLHETIKNCPQDCLLALCGNNLCASYEIGICPEDCTTSCGDGKCIANENYLNCSADCWNTCGDGGCEPWESQVSCAQDCTTTCGDGKCIMQENPSTCATDCPSKCGDNVCNDWEDVAKCPADCPKCGDGICNQKKQETCQTCPSDCKPCPYSNGCTIQPKYPTCAGCLCEATVCAFDDWCCTKNWDEICVAECIAVGTKCP